MNFTKIIFCCLVFFAFGHLGAQTLDQALRFAQTESASTARSAGLGGGMSALGGDFSVINLNPAGLAIYRGSEFMLTPSLGVRSNNATLLNGGSNPETSEIKVPFSFDNLGVVFASRRSGNLKTSNFSIGFNRLADFREDFSFEGESTGSIADQYLELATGANGLGIPAGNLDDFIAGPAFDAFAIDDFINADGEIEYFNDFENFPDAQIFRQQRMERKGSISELSFSYGANVKNKWLFGLGIGIPFLSFTEVREYEEIDTNGAVDFFDNQAFYDTTNVSGTGFNAKLGVIYWAKPTVRVGLAVHTPTFYNLEEYYDTRIDYTLTVDGMVSSAFGQPGFPREIDYSFRTPWRYIGSAGIIIKKFGLLSAEVEYADYSSLNYNADKDGNFIEDIDRAEAVNDEIDSRLKNAINLRFGAEYRVERYLLRAGFNWQGSTLEGVDNPRTRISIGGGYRGDSYYADVALVRSMQTAEYRPYDLSNDAAEQVVEQDLSNNRIMFTLGFKF